MLLLLQSVTRDVFSRAFTFTFTFSFHFHFTTTISMSLATSPNSGHLGPHTPPRSQAISVKHAKSSPVSKVSAYYLPENREQYQNFGYNDSFLLGDFDNQSEFLQFLSFESLDSVPDICLEGKRSFVELANKVADHVKKREHCLFLYLGFLPTYDFHFRFPRRQYPRVP